jgi:hypothetical protein
MKFLHFGHVRKFMVLPYIFPTLLTCGTLFPSTLLSAEELILPRVSVLEEDADWNNTAVL